MPRPRTFFAASLVAAALLVGGCGESTPDAGTPPTPTPSPVYPTPTITPVESGSAVLPGATLTPDGLGPVQLGLKVDEGVRRGWVARLDHCDRWGASPELMAEGIDLLFDDDQRLVEVWLGNPLHRTDEYVRVGMHIEDATAIYRERLEFEQRDSVGGKFFVSFVREGDREIAFYAIGDENATPGWRSPISAIGARAYGLPIERPAC